jgi:hypothetical protein
MLQTALYLEAALVERGHATTVFSGSTPHDERSGGTQHAAVVATDAVVGALDLPEGFQGISYDLPFDPERMEARWLSLKGLRGQTLMATLVDLASVDEVEHRLVRKHQLVAAELGPTDD